MESLDNDVPPTDPLQALPMAASTARLPKRQSVPEGHPLSQSETTLPYRRSNPSVAPLFASTLTPPGSRSGSPMGRGSPARPLSGSVFGGPAGRSLIDDASDSPGDPRNLIMKAYVPHVAIYASPDTEELAKDKGFKNGVWELLRPFGEQIQGKVTIRDSNGASRSWEDYSVRFVKFGENIEPPGAGGAKGAQSAVSNGQSGSALGSRSNYEDVENVVERHLSYAEESFLNTPHHGLTRQGLDVEATSPYYSLYLRRLLSGIPVSPHETFAHPVACVIAISSRSPSPIDDLRKLYNDTSSGENRLPVWVDGDYLRYYVLVHDEERDDITRSLALFDQMKRHLGLHCHLLRLRSTQSAETDDDSIPLPRSDWMSAAEEMADIRHSEDQEDFEDPTRHIFESDATAIRTFVREMVTQSIIPTMERHVSLWNDQVASRRRGITGRFMNLSRKWGGFGSSSRNSVVGGSSSSSAYDTLGFYRADASEAIMRKLADFAFMLRDWKLAHSTYDLLRSDFSDAKAWKYHAAANEMAAASLLIMPQSLPSKSRGETIDQMLEAAFYSYHTRCSSPFGALRSLTLGIELLRLRGGSCIDDAVRWGIRLLDSKILGSVGDALMKERLAVCYASKPGVGSGAWGHRKRKSAMWCILAGEAWHTQQKYIQSQRCLNEAGRIYSEFPHENGISKFNLANDFVSGLQHDLDDKLDVNGEGNQSPSQGVEELIVDEESEPLDLRSRRASMMGRGAVPAASLETAPLHEVTSPVKEKADGSVQDEFG
ncbi:TRAPP complex protein TRS85 [Colletotrichum higginsianum]|uniref:TRAPP complex protein TRS85 n=1 Tax=Colletotrichum higginsianum (strain IMI 349063) TaxID=759273 RepID=H1VBL6_COLHI|nr:TRAPP complex protein TRS85 [Colletotrichum higginsianum IMI 349063]OBR12654.1 TRAPP complex protein TRS85 [Colletotrichum higginsianum IMI 349063]CCF37619.1 TRAPP complex protein TRS85 [Colletotrichum higginsianum]